VAVVRVELRGPDPGELLVTVLEVGRNASGDRVLGTASDPDAACELLHRWLSTLGGSVAER
jgi:hypothetical protein